ncbi:MAG: outer membrane lipid asymmetry maintenance protein MlaD [Alphaproteobacteria bacterium]
MKQGIIETVLGGVVLLVALVFLAFAYTSSDLRPVQGYRVTAQFNAIDGLTVGSDVRIAGVKVGSVVGQHIDPDTYRAVVTLSLSPEVRLPADTVVKIASEGLLGGKYVKLEPGGGERIVTADGQLTETRDVVSLEELLGRVIFLVTDEPKG